MKYFLRKNKNNLRHPRYQNTEPLANWIPDPDPYSIMAPIMGVWVQVVFLPEYIECTPQTAVKVSRKGRSVK